jgi:hypothetical protein
VDDSEIGHGLGMRSLSVIAENHLDLTRGYNNHNPARAALPEENEEEEGEEEEEEEEYYEVEN